MHKALAVAVRVARVERVHGDSHVAEHRLGPCGRNDNLARAICKGIGECPDDAKRDRLLVATRERGGKREKGGRGGEGKGGGGEGKRERGKRGKDGKGKEKVSAARARMGTVAWLSGG